MSRHRDRHRAQRQRSWLARWRDRYPDPGLAESSSPAGDLAVAFGISWLARRRRERKRRGR